MKKENNGRNILNVAEIEAFLDLQIRGKSKPFQQWLRRNLRNYILKEEKSLLCLPANLRSLLHAMAVAVGGTPDRMKKQVPLPQKERTAGVVRASVCRRGRYSLHLHKRGGVRISHRALV